VWTSLSVTTKGAMVAPSVMLMLETGKMVGAVVGPAITAMVSFSTFGPSLTLSVTVAEPGTPVVGVSVIVRSPPRFTVPPGLSKTAVQTVASTLLVTARPKAFGAAAKVMACVVPICCHAPATPALLVAS
jgi:hypothetical protein